VLIEFTEHRRPPESLDAFVLEVKRGGGDLGAIHLLPAGAAPSSAYWKKLAKLDWHQLFYAENPEGVPIFLEWKAMIEEVYNPDFLLLDARTGITEMGGVATTVLADQVVFLMLGTREHLEGSRAIMRSMRALQRPEGHPPVDIVAVLSRMPQRNDENEAKELGRVRAFLNESAENLAETLDIDEVYPLHREAALEEREQLLVGTGQGIDDSMLLADYVRLFTRFVPQTEFDTVGKMIEDIFERAKDDPDEAENAMEALNQRCFHPTACRALLKMYKMRRSPWKKRIRAARMLWRMTKDSSDSMLWDVVKTYEHNDVFDGFELADELLYIDFVESVWFSHRSDDSVVAEKIVRLCALLEDHDRAARTLEKLLASTDNPASSAVVKLIDMYCERRNFRRALEITSRFKDTMNTVDTFLEAWVHVVLAEADYAHTSALVNDPKLDLALLAKRNGALVGRLRLFKGERDAANEIFGRLMTLNWRALTNRTMVTIGAFARDLGQTNEFTTRLKKSVDEAKAASINEALAKTSALAVEDFGYDGGDDIPF
jgi:hypothetical protein